MAGPWEQYAADDAGPWSRYEPPQPPPAQEGGAGAWLGRRARDVIEGLAGFPSAAIDVIAPGIAAQRAIMPDDLRRRFLPSLSDVATGAADAVGLPRPQTPEERMTSAVVQGAVGAIPTMGIGAGAGAFNRGVSYASQLVGGAAGGAASEAAGQAGYGPVAQLLAGVAGGVGGAGVVQAAGGGLRALGGAVEPFTNAGRERIALETIQRASSDPANLAARVAAGAADADARLPGAPVTAGMAARDEGLMTFERGLRSRVDANVPLGQRGPGQVLRDMEAQRNALREAELLSMADGSDPQLRGAAVRGEPARQGNAGAGLRGAESARRAAVRRAYEAIDPDGTTSLPTAPLIAAVDAERAGRWGAGAGDIPAPLRALFDDLDDAGNAQPWAFMQRVRSRASALAGDPAADSRVQASARAVVEAVDSAAQSAVNGGGFTADQAQRWRTATELRRRLGEDFDRDTTGANATGRILARADYGAPRMPDESVPRTALQNVSALRQTLRAAGGNAAEVRGALQGQFIEDLMNAARTTGQRADAAGTVTAILSPAGFDRHLRQNMRVAVELFDPQQMRRLQRLSRDFAESSLADSAASARGSPTVQNMSVGNLLARASNGLIDPASPGWQAFGSLGGALRAVYGPAEVATNAIITRAVSDPQFFAMLSARATPAMIERTQRYIQQNMLDRAAGAAGTAAFRQTVRTAGEEERRRAQ